MGERINWATPTAKLIEEEILSGMPEHIHKVPEVLGRTAVTSFLEQLAAEGIFNSKKKKLTRETYLFVESVDVGGGKFIDAWRRTKAYETSPMLALATRLSAAGAILQKTEHPCARALIKKRHEEPYNAETYELERLRTIRFMEIRDRYIAHRINATLSNRPDAVGILLMGARHKPRPSVPTKVFHRADVIPLSFWERYQNTDGIGNSLLVEPDDFGHAPRLPATTL